MLDSVGCLLTSLLAAISTTPLPNFNNKKCVQILPNIAHGHIDLQLRAIVLRYMN